MSLRAVLHSRVVLGLCLVLTVAVPVLTMPHLQRVSPWPLVMGLGPWVVGKYVLCPLRWQVLTRTAPTPLGRRWFLRTFAESELLGLLTPGHVGADVWRVHRLTASGLTRGDALMRVGADRLVGGVGLSVFVAFAATTLPVRMLLIALGVGAVILVAGLVLRRVRPGLLPSGPPPRPKALAVGLVLAAGYQLTIAGLLLGTVAAIAASANPDDGTDEVRPRRGLPIPDEAQRVDIADQP